MSNPRVPVTPQDRIQQNSIPEPNTGCWLWEGAVHPKTGYGFSSLRRQGIKSVMAHRASFMAFKGPIPEGLQVLHKCDMPCCVNPDHLFSGTQQQNIDDMIAKGRRPSSERLRAAALAHYAAGREPPTGESNGQAKLTATDVYAIRASADTQSVLAERYGVSRSQISEIRSRKKWRHLA